MTTHTTVLAGLDANKWWFPWISMEPLETAEADQMPFLTPSYSDKDLKAKELVLYNYDNFHCSTNYHFYYQVFLYK